MKFYGKQDYSEKGQKNKTQEFGKMIEQRVLKTIDKNKLFNFKTISEEKSFLKKIKKIFK